MTALLHELNFALKLAKRCGEIAISYWKTSPEVLNASEKPGQQGPVTRADLEINSQIVEALHDAFPDDAVVAEETAQTNQQPSWNTYHRCWFIDPIDGTSEFIRGEPSWAIHIGLCIGGKPSLGVVYIPANRHLFWGVSTLEYRSAMLQVKEEKPHLLWLPHEYDEKQLRLVSSKSHESPRINTVVSELSIAQKNHLRTGSTGVKITTVAQCLADFYIHPSRGTRLWDSCAPQVILEAAGGVLTDLFGHPLNYQGTDFENRFGLLAASRALHPYLVEKLRHHVQQWL